MIGELYKCIEDKGYNLKVGVDYRVVRMAEVYLPQHETMDVVDVVVFDKDLWIPKYDFNRCFIKVDEFRSNKIDTILK